LSSTYQTLRTSLTRS